MDVNSFASGDPATWLQTMSAEYRELMDGLSKDDMDGRRERMRPIIEEVNAMKIVDTVHMKPPTTRLKAYIKQFEGLVGQSLGT
jgi:hypothetical protein